MSRRKLLPTEWTYWHNPVEMIPSAEIPETLRPGGELAHLVQLCLNLRRTWRPSKKFPVWEVPVRGLCVPPAAVEVAADTPRIWGINGNHTRLSWAQTSASPFVVLPQDQWPMTSLITIEMMDSPRYPVLRRAYFGPRTLLQPWHSPQNVTPQEIQARQAFWRTHAYLETPFTPIQPGSISGPPAWWTSTG